MRAGARWTALGLAVAVLVLLAIVAVNPSLWWWAVLGLVAPVVIAAIRTLSDVGSRTAEYALIVALIGVVCVVSVTFLGRTNNFLALDTEPATFSVDAVLLEHDSGRYWDVTTRLALEAGDLDRALDALGASRGDGWEKMGANERDAALSTLVPALEAAGYTMERNRDSSLVFATQSTEEVGTIGMPPQHRWAANTTIRVNTPRVADLLFETDEKSVLRMVADCHAVVSIRPGAESTCTDGQEEHVVSLDRGGPVESAEVTAKILAPWLRYPGVNTAAVAPFQWWIGGAIALIVAAAGLAIKDALKGWWKSLFTRILGSNEANAADS